MSRVSGRVDFVWLSVFVLSELHTASIACRPGIV